ncbi:MAG: MazG family protein, partial [Chloroflexota bacterium]|nr:MazG family protein [Chloroflexota bacterium]
MSARVTVVGLGPGDPALRTVGAQAALDRADRIVLRTLIHPGLDDLAADSRAIGCDDLYEGGASFDEVYAAVADRVLGEAAARQDGEVVFAVPGHPRFGERSVRLLTERAAAAGVGVEVQAATSALDVVAVAVDADPFGDELQLRDALDLVDAVEREPFGGGLIALDPSRPCLVNQVYAPAVAASVKLALARLYPDDHPVVVVRAAGVPSQERLSRCRLFELDRQSVDHLTSVWVLPLPPLEAHRSPQTLQRIVAHLRAPGGCPWDRKQTHGSLRSALIEEAYETVDAIDAGDADNLAEELGDLLLQVALHAQIAEEAGGFVLEDVYEHVSAKLLRRHPHVFGDVEARTPDDVVTTWEAVKAAERANAGDERPEHPLDRLPRSMPALTRAA